MENGFILTAEEDHNVTLMHVDSGEGKNVDAILEQARLKLTENSVPEERIRTLVKRSSKVVKSILERLSAGLRRGGGWPRRHSNQEHVQEVDDRIATVVHGCQGVGADKHQNILSRLFFGVMEQALKRARGDNSSDYWPKSMPAWYLVMRALQNSEDYEDDMEFLSYIEDEAQDHQWDKPVTFNYKTSKVTHGPLEI